MENFFLSPLGRLPIFFFFRFGQTFNNTLEMCLIHFLPSKNTFSTPKTAYSWLNTGTVKFLLWVEKAEVKWGNFSPKLVYQVSMLRGYFGKSLNFQNWMSSRRQNYRSTTRTNCIENFFYWERQRRMSIMMNGFNIQSKKEVSKLLHIYDLMRWEFSW